MPQAINENLPDSWKEWELVKVIGKGAYGVVYEARKAGFSSPNDTNSTGYTPEASKSEHRPGVDYVSAIKVISIPPEGMGSDSIMGVTLDKDSEKSYYRNIVEEFEDRKSVV